ncbi:MAG: N-acetyl-alpha-D-glucosaminyl L-malate synthase BshA [Planctomycetes bacterium]|nr:N-acetyl-alpha-D-glucosaminyl L-malate synthase BshA [Planctomycetota bacterium]
MTDPIAPRAQPSHERDRSALKIGILCHPTYGGSGVVASELALTLAERGHTVHLFSHDVPPRLAHASGSVVMHVAQGFPYPLFHSTPHDLAITSTILSIHRQSGLDILHAHYALPHAVSAYLARSAAIADRGRPAPRIVTTLHGTDITLVGNDPSYAPLTQFVIEQSDAVTAVSQNLARRTRENFCRVPLNPCAIEVIPNGVDTDRFHPSAGEGREPGVPTAVHVSNFRPVKRVPWLLEAFALATAGTEARLELVGAGPDQQACRARARELGLESRVEFLGERNHLPEVLAPADVFLLTSSDESFGLSALEAMSCGTPVVATDVGGVGEVVEDGVSGLLSGPDDLAGFAANLKILLFDRRRARTLGQAARRRAEEQFARVTVVQRYEDLYCRLLGHARTPCP